MENILRTLFLLTFFYYPLVMDAQLIPSIQWQKSLGGSSGETSNSILQTADGGFITAGYSWSVNGDVSGGHGLSDYWIVKLDPGGNILWQKTYGGSENDVAWSMKQTADGGFVIAGYSRSSDGNISLNHGLTDYCIMKLDSSGNLMWEKSLGGSNDDWAYAVEQTSDLGFIVAGFSKSSDGDVTLNQGDWDYWIVKLDPAGNLMWQKSLGGSDEDEAYALTETSDGGYVIGGSSSSDDGDVTGNHGDDDYWIVKLSAAGEMIWQKSLGGSAADYAYALEQTSDHGFIVAGSSSSNDGDVSGNHGHTDYSVMKLESDGNLEWQKSFGGSDYDVANAVEQTSDGGFIITGDSYSDDGDVSSNYGLDDYWTVKLDTAGNLQWQKSLGGSGYDQAHAIQQTTDSRFIIAGLSFSNDEDVTGNHNNSLGNTEDYWIVKLSDGTESGIEGIASDYITVFPNPALNFLIIDLPAAAINSIVRVYDAQGNMIYTPITFNGSQAQLDISSLPEGFYFVETTDVKGKYSARQKFVKVE